MNITPFDIYILGTVDSIIGALAAIILITIGILIIYSVLRFIYCDDNDIEHTYPHLKPLISILITLGLLVTLIPNKKTLAAMYIIPAVVNNEKLQGISSNLLDTLLNLTNEWAKDTVPDKLTNGTKL